MLMASSPKSLQERIGDAYTYHLIHLRPEVDVPEDLRHRFQELATRMTSVEPIGDEGSIAATVAKMSTEEAVRVAEEIVYMWDAVSTAWHDQ